MGKNIRQSNEAFGLGLERSKGGGIGYESFGASARVTTYPSLRRYA